jgi:hypothetical protein
MTTLGASAIEVTLFGTHGVAEEVPFSRVPCRNHGFQILRWRAQFPPAAETYLLGIKVHRQKSKWRESRAWSRNRSTSSFSGGLRIAEAPLAARLLHLVGFFSTSETRERSAVISNSQATFRDGQIRRNCTESRRRKDWLFGGESRRSSSIGSCVPVSKLRNSVRPPVMSHIARQYSPPPVSKWW